jgi:catechol 2,3-dioxygenase-like lactoylglutathione lyase family enzyme
MIGVAVARQTLFDYTVKYSSCTLNRWRKTMTSQTTTGTTMTVPGQPNVAGTLGAHHTAFPCWDPAETIRLYEGVLGLPMVHAIPAQGWGKDENPDMVHFFFDIGNGDTLAFFYYLGWQRPEPPHQVLRQANHVAVEVQSEEALIEFRERLEGAGYDVMTVAHEVIESIYIDDPNGLFFEMTVPTRTVTELDTADSRRTMEALEEVIRSSGPPSSIHDVWRVKAQRNRPVGGAALHVVDAPEWAGAVEYARGAGYSVEDREGVFVIHDDRMVEIDRKASGLHPAVWYTVPTGGLEGRITCFDRNVLRIEA